MKGQFTSGKRKSPREFSRKKEAGYRNNRNDVCTLKQGQQPGKASLWAERTDEKRLTTQERGQKAKFNDSVQTVRRGKKVLETSGIGQTIHLPALKVREGKTINSTCGRSVGLQQEKPQRQGPGRRTPINFFP